MKQYILNCFIIYLITLILSICFNFSIFESIISFLVLFLNVQLRDLIDDFKNNKEQ